MSEAMRRVKQQMLVAADEYEAAGQTLKAHALRALVYGEAVGVEVRSGDWGASEVTVTVTHPALVLPPRGVTHG